MAFIWVRLNIKIHFGSKNFIFFFNHTSRPKKQTGNIVLANFVGFLRASLSKLAGYQYIKPDLIDMDFWGKMHLKFSAVKHYDKSLVRKKMIFLNIVVEKNYI